MADWIISRLNKNHDRSQFSCGKAPLDAFLHSLVSQYEKRRVGRTFVVTEPDSSFVAGYYTLAVGAVDISTLPESDRKKLPQHPIPVLHLGRLAVNKAHQGRRLGETLLYHALRAILVIAETAGVFAVDLWAIDDEARAFYEKYGFVTLADHPLHLYLPMKTVEAMFDP